jgi:hypothetical protein
VSEFLMGMWSLVAILLGLGGLYVVLRVVLRWMGA